MKHYKFSKILIISFAAQLWLLNTTSADPSNQSNLEALGKYVFFANFSSPPRQACVTCHDPAMGWTGRVPAINLGQVAIPGANPHTVGGRKPPAVPYAKSSPPFSCTPDTSTPRNCTGGMFWDTRAEGNNPGELPGAMPHVGIEVFDSSEQQTEYGYAIGPLADQALGPFANDVELGLPPGSTALPGALAVCQAVQSSQFAPLYQVVWDVPIDCSSSDQAINISFERIGLALSAYMHSTEVSPFDSKRDQALAGQVTLTAQEQLGQTLFFGTNPATGHGGRCSGCHNRGGFSAADNPFTNNGQRHIGVPPNFNIANFDPTDPDTGLSVRTGRSIDDGFVKVPTVRNVDKRRGNVAKAYMHNGYLQSLEQVVHFYNTRDELNDPINCPAGTTAAQAIQRDCWPNPEVLTNFVPTLPGAVGLGRLGLTVQEEAAIVAFLKTLSDTTTVQQPPPYTGN